MAALPLNQQLRNGLSNARNPIQYNNINGSVNNGAASLVAAPTGQFSTVNAARDIENANRAATGYKTPLQFPTDMPKYHFRLLENEWNIGGRGLSIERWYTLPLPMQGIEDNFSVNYDTNYSPIAETASAIGNIFQVGEQAAAGLAASAARATGAVTGRTLNQFKTITLGAPDFKEFSLSWKLAPKTYDEAQNIQKIYWSLRRGMSPRFDPIFGRLLFVFPKIYTMYFNPNFKYLYKFKPCVLRNLSVNFTGGNPHPTFYKPQGTPSESPPESVIITMTFLELEYWVESDIKAANDLPINDPFDVWNWYRYRTNDGGEGLTDGETTPATGGTAAAGRINSRARQAGQ